MIGSLFSGIGGLELGLERAGLGPVAWQVEMDPFCRKVLAKHWPSVDRSVVDVREANASNLSRVDVICGGFPCQDVSSAGKGAGLDGARSRLWYGYARIVGEPHPRIVVVENVASGAPKWLSTVRQDLYVLGYDTTAFALSAADVGAPHERARIFVVAYPYVCGEYVCPIDAETPGVPSDSEGFWNGWQTDAHALRMAHGLSDDVDTTRRLKALGNAVVPQCAEVIGRWIARAP